MTTSREFLELALSGAPLTVDHLDALVSGWVREDECLDYKSGELLTQSSSKPARVVREYISGFANSDGGVLVLGIEEADGRADKIEGCNPVDVGGSLSEWAARSLTNLGAYFSPAPRFEEVVVGPNRVVLICAVARSYNLVPVIESGKMAYYFRLGDQTLKAPDYMLADFFLGRRARPILEVIEWEFHNVDTGRPRKDSADASFSFTLEFRLPNSGLVWAEESRWGVVMESAGSNTSLVAPNSYLRTLIDFVPIESSQGNVWQRGRQVHYRDKVSLEEPFASPFVMTAWVYLPFTYQRHPLQYQWKAALYITAKNSAPVWYQLELTINSDLRELLLNRPDDRLLYIPEDWPGFSITKLHGERPVVGWVREEKSDA